MTISRRSLILFSLCSAAQRLLGQNQGIATREVKAQPKPAPSGKVFNAHFTDVAHEAGLRAPVIYGGIDAKKYIVEATVRLRLFRLRQRWLDGYLSSLGGTRPRRRSAGSAQSAVQEQSRRHIHRCNREGRTDRMRLGHRRLRRRLQQRRLRRPLRAPTTARTRSIATTATAPSPMSQRKAGLLQPKALRLGRGLHFLDYNRDGLLDLFVSNYSFSIEHSPAPGANSNMQLLKGIPVNCGPRGLPNGQPSALPQQRRRHLHRRDQRVRNRRATESYGMTVSPPTSTRMDGPTSLWPAIPLRACFHE